MIRPGLLRIVTNRGEAPRVPVVERLEQPVPLHRPERALYLRRPDSPGRLQLLDVMLDPEPDARLICAALRLHHAATSPYLGGPPGAGRSGGGGSGGRPRRPEPLAAPASTRRPARAPHSPRLPPPPPHPH